MKREGKIILIITLTLVVAALTFASDEGILKLQGVVMAVDVKQNIFTVNERTFSWDRQTGVFNEKGLPITTDKLKLRGWVYVEGFPDKANRRNIARKIYLIPKYINDKEKHLYSFME